MPKLFHLRYPDTRDEGLRIRNHKLDKSLETKDVVDIKRLVTALTEGYGRYRCTENIFIMFSGESGPTDPNSKKKPKQSLRYRQNVVLRK